MPTNKQAVIRYQALNKCFRNTGRQYFIDDLVEACSGSNNQFIPPHLVTLFSLVNGSKIKGEIHRSPYGRIKDKIKKY